jgi:hypothetical protein
MRKIKLQNQEYQVDDLLAEYKIEWKLSSNVEFFGDDGNNIFVQFKNGKSYIYQNVIKEHIEQMHAAESIGKFVGAVAKLYNYVPIDYALVKLVAQPVVE